MKYIFVTMFTLIAISINSFAQKAMLLTNGKAIQIKDYKYDEKGFIAYKNKKGKSRTISDYEVFAIKNSDGSERVFYKPYDESSFTIQEMKSFVAGQSDAVATFKSPLTTVGGFACGVAAPFIQPTFAIVFSGAYTGTIGITKPFEKKIKIPQQYIDNEHYKLGYKRVANRKRIRNAIIGSLIGLVAGYTAYYVIKN